MIKYNKFEGKWDGVYVVVCRKEKEGRNVITLWSRKGKKEKIIEEKALYNSYVVVIVHT